MTGRHGERVRVFLGRWLSGQAARTSIGAWRACLRSGCVQSKNSARVAGDSAPGKPQWGTSRLPAIRAGRLSIRLGSQIMFGSGRQAVLTQLSRGADVCT
jgi:hypothetical protein